MRTLVLLALASVALAQVPSQVCMFVQPAGSSSLKFVCDTPAKLGLASIPGPSGPAGPAGPTGPQGPAGAAITGGPCSNADGSVGLFVKLPNNTCLPVIVSGNAIIASAGAKDTSGNQVAPGTSVEIAGLTLLATWGIMVGVPGR